MPRTQPFESHADQYEAWFTRHPLVYQSELFAVRQLLPAEGKGIEIGVGSGRFAAPLGIRFGIEPARQMAKIARDLDIYIVQGIGETLPFRDEQFDFALMVTTICFLDNPQQALWEIRRILRPKGIVLLGFVDKQSAIGQYYFKNKIKSRFYQEAEFYSVKTVLDLLHKAHYTNMTTVQTLFSPLEKITHVEPVKSGYGDGSFIVVKANK